VKTPEQMAEEFFENWQPEKPKYIRPKARQYALEKVTECFIAGYQAAQQWISVKERLPEDGDDLSIMLVWRNIEHDYDTVRWRYQQGWDCVIQDKSTITHWMPLPSVKGLKHED